MIAPQQSHAASRLGSGAAALAQHDADEIGGILGTELFHDARAVHFDCARADTEFATRLLVGGPGGDLAEHIALARGEKIVPGKCLRYAFATLGAPRPGLDGLAHPRHHGTGVEWLLDEIKRAVLDRLHRHRNIANARYDEDRRRVLLRVQFP